LQLVFLLKFLLWNQYQLFDPELILSPGHQDLIRVSEMVSDFLSDRRTTFAPAAAIRHTAYSMADNPINKMTILFFPSRLTHNPSFLD
jgi:hypothetical protein